MFFDGPILAASEVGRDDSVVVPFTAETTGPGGRPIPPQWEFINSTAQAIELDCSRQCGKTVGIVKRTAKRSWEQPGRRTLYINHTLANAKRQFFDPPGEAYELGLLGTLERHGIGCGPNRTEVFAELENGSFIQAVGCDNIGEVRKKLGFFWHEVLIDEIQDYAEELIDLLIKKTLAPTLIKTRGTLVLSGTPPAVLVGFWNDVIAECERLGDQAPYTRFHWTMLDNPAITRQGIVDEMGKAGFVVDFDHPENNHPIVQREVFGRRVADTTALMYEYQEGRNDLPHDFVAPPEHERAKWCFSMGVDIGGINPGNDSDGVVVWGWRIDDPAHSISEMESHRWGEDTHDRLDSEQFCHAVLDVFRRWRPMVAACADTGGAGAVKAIAWLAKRMNGLEFTAKPTSVELSQRLFNDELRSGRMKINPQGALAKALRTAKRGKHEPDVAAAGRYAHHGATHFLGKDRTKKEETYDQYIARNIRERERRRRLGIRGVWNPQAGRGLGGPWRANAGR